MKFKFKVQPYQTSAVEAVVDCFAGQPAQTGIQYRIDPGNRDGSLPFEDAGFRNANLQLTNEQILANIRSVQLRQNLSPSVKLETTKACAVNLDVEMETGTGKTYCYIKSIFELNKRYGWSKFIIVVPSIAIREGVYKSLAITAEHFVESYGKKARFFLYNSKQLHHLESFSSDAGINVMVINVQAFASRGADARRIYGTPKLNAKGEVELIGLDEFQSRKPIDIIRQNRPILILDEPQKMEGPATTQSLAEFQPLFTLRYSATHRTSYNRIHRLDALDAYNQKLVKKIAVRGISVKGIGGTQAYLYLESIEISRDKPPVARLEMEVKHKSGIKRELKKLSRGKDLFVESNELDQYRGFTIANIDFTTDSVEFTNGVKLLAGEALGDVSETMMRRLQIRETIKAHLEKEKRLFGEGIKVLSLFFIDEVSKYRDYKQPDEMGEYARMFEEEYEALKDEFLGELALDHVEYRKHLAAIETRKTHGGYFSIDKKTKRDVDPSIAKTGENKGLSDDVDAYDLILKDKERLLSFAEPMRFLFSHSALREGWDNPNVFSICMLKHSDNTISRRQEVGRGLRLCVNQHGDRQDQAVTVHETNVLTVVANESYQKFVTELQKEITAELTGRPRKADAAYFTGKRLEIATPEGTRTVEVTPEIAKAIERYLVKNDYLNDDDTIAPAYHEAQESSEMAPLPLPLLALVPGVAPEALASAIQAQIQSLVEGTKLPVIENGRTPKTNPLNRNFEKKEFQELWGKIHHKAIYKVDFDSSELVQKCIRILDRELQVTPLQYTTIVGELGTNVTESALQTGTGFVQIAHETFGEVHSVRSQVRYDLLGKLAEQTVLTRRTMAEILGGIQPGTFAKFKQNPEQFLSEVSRLIQEQKATLVIEHLTYDTIAESYDSSIFTQAQVGQDLSGALKMNHHVFDYVVTDSKVEKEFAGMLDTSKEVVVYSKLPRGFLIPTPVGDYNPDWAVAFKEGEVKHVYFVAETKGTMSSMKLREIEKTKIECARRFFSRLAEASGESLVRYEMVDSYGKLMELVK